MAQRGVIRSRLTLDSKEFYQKMDAALKKAQQTAAAMQKAFGKPLKLPTIPNPTTATGGGSRGDPALRAQREAAQRGAAAVRDLELAYRKGRVSLDQLIAGAQKWERQLEQERSQLAENTKGYAAYTTALRGVENVLSRASRGGDTRPITNGINDISDALDRLQAAGAIFLAGGFFSRFFTGLDRLARGNTQAKNALTLYRNELRDAGRDVDAEVARLDKLAARFKTNTEALSRFALILTRQGFTGEQQANMIEAVGASALNAGRDLNEAFSTAGDAFARRDSALLNGLGIITNFDDALQDYAKTQGVTADALDKASQNQAIYSGFIRETRQEVAALDVLLAGYAGSSASLENAQLGFGRTVGGVVTPALTFLKDTLALLLNLFNALPGPIKAVAVAAGVLTAAITALGVAYISLRVLLLNQTVLGPVVATLLQNETILRSRLGAAIIVQARAYGILDKAQVRNAVTARSTAVANAAAAGSAGKLTTVLGLLAKVRPFLALTALIAIAREASRYLGVFQPVIDQVRASLNALAQTKVGQFFSNLIEQAGGLGQVFSRRVLDSVTLVAIAMNAAVAATRSLGAAFQFLGDLATKGPAEAFDLLQTRLQTIKAETDATTNAILDSNEAYRAQINTAKGAAESLELVADAAINTKNALSQLSEEDRKVFQDFETRAGDLSKTLSLDLDAGDLQQQVQSVTGEVDTLVSEIQTKSATLKDNGPLRYLLTGLELDLRRLEGRAVENIYADAVRQAQDAATDEAINALQDGTQKIEATYQQRIEVERRAFDQLTKGLEKDSPTYLALLQAFNVKISAITAQGQRELQEDAEQRLETQRQLVSDLSDLQSQIAVAEAEASGNTVAQINARSLESARQIERERQEMLERVTGNDETARAQRAQINATYDDLERQNTQKLTRDIEAEHERRANTLEQITRRTAELRAQTLAANQRDQGNEVGAIETELKARLEAIDEALEDELEAEDLTQKQITALHEKANAERIAARQEASRQTQAIVKQEAEATKQALTESNQEVEQAKQGTVQGEIPRLRAQFAAEQNERRAADEQRLADFKGTEEERQRLIANAGQREGILTRQNQLQINKLEREARQAYAAAVKEYQQQVTDAYVSALQTQINKLTELRDLQTGIVSSGSTILQFIKNREELTGGAGGANETQIDNFLNSQLNSYEELYRQSLKMNGPLEDRVELQEKIKSLIDGAKEDGYSLTLDPSIARLMAGDELSQVANFPARAAEALQKTKALDEQIAEATSMLTKLLGAAAGEEGLKLKVTIDKSGIEQAKQELANAFGPEQANKIIGQAEQAGTNAGKGLIDAFAEGVSANREKLGAVIRSVMQTEVRDFLTGSNAKKGPLSDVIESGGGLVTGYAGGMRRQFPTLRTTAFQMASIAKPAIAAIPTSRPAHFPAAAGAGAGVGGPLIGTLNVNGAPTTPSSVFEMSAQQFGKTAARVARQEINKRR